MKINGFILKIIILIFVLLFCNKFISQVEGSEMSLEAFKSWFSKQSFNSESARYETGVYNSMPDSSKYTWYTKIKRAESGFKYLVVKGLVASNNQNYSLLPEKVKLKSLTLNSNNKITFIKDFQKSSNTIFRDSVTADTSLINSWVLLKNLGSSKSTDIDTLRFVSNYKKYITSKDSYFKVNKVYSKIPLNLRVEFQTDYLANAIFRDSVTADTSLIRAWSIVKRVRTNGVRVIVDTLRVVANNIVTYKDWKEKVSFKFDTGPTQGNTTNLINDIIDHIVTIEIIAKGKGKGKKFKGCHSKLALDSFCNEVGKKRSYELDSKASLINGVYSAKPKIRDSTAVPAKDFIKANNGGKSTFFPDSWSKLKIKQEVEYAVLHNHGKVGGTEYKGYSKDGAVEIHFYYSSNKIGSYFPVMP